MSRRRPDTPPMLVLASGSPRRRELLDLLAVPYRVQPAGIREEPRAGETAVAFAQRVARDKALAVAARGHDLPVLAADTVVETGGEMLGKPASPAEAAAMLRRLSGAWHSVHTGMALATAAGCATLVDTATVSFRPLEEGAIGWYVATGEPMDKAGGYAVQGAGGLLVERVEGSPHTVVGLPLYRLPELFAMVGLDFWRLLRSHSALSRDAAVW